MAWIKGKKPKEERMETIYESIEGSIWYGGMQIFMVVWIVFVSITITSRLERIIKLLEEKK